MSLLRTVSLRHLRCFVEVADSGSFTIASSRLFLTQSSLTATIQQFEEAVGLKLFDRTTRRVAMTDAALRFKIEADKILNHFDSALSDLQAFSQSQQGHIRIAAAASVIEQFLVQAISTFREAYPNVTFSLRDAGAQEVEQMVYSGTVDFAITSRHKGNPDLVYTPLLEDRYGLACRKDHPLAGSKTALDWASLSSDGFVAFSEDTGIGTYLREHTARWRLFDGRHDEISSTTSLYAMLRGGGCFSIVPALAANVEEFKDLAFRQLKGPVLTRQICLITRRLRSLSPSSQRILDVLADSIRQARLPPGVFISSVAPAKRTERRRAGKPATSPARRKS
jgi:DNA-binding transcriptional LysR family regulator